MELADGGAREVRKKITAVFADMAGSTALAEQLDPEVFRAVVRRFFERLAAVIEEHGGQIENLVGDEVSGLFGVPLTREDDAQRAVAAAVDMLSELEALNGELEPRLDVRLQIRIGINTGTVLVGEPIAGRPMALGDAVTVAARLEKKAAPGEILIGEETYRLVRGAFKAEAAGELELRGRTEPIAAHRLLKARPTAAGEAPVDGPLIGRGRELSLVGVAFQRALARRGCEFVTIAGDAGVGKSRLVAEVFERYRPQARLLVGRCLPYGRGSTFWPLVEIVSQATAIDDADPADVALAKLDAALVKDPDGAAVARHLAQIVGLADDLEPGEHTFWAVQRLLAAIASDRPLIVVIEDLHWAEPTLLDLVEHVARRSRSAPILLIATARFDLLDQRPSWEDACPTIISLRPLGRDEVTTMIELLVGASLPAAVHEQLVEVAAGNPLFVEQVLSMLVDEGELRRTPDGWVADPGLDEVVVPPTVEAILAARIDHLSEGERLFAERASVIGKEFAAESVLALGGRAGDNSLEGLMRKQLIEPIRRAGPIEDYRFRHLLVRDVVYESMSKARRGELHERFADWLVEWASSRLGQFEEILGYHLESAYRYRRELLADDEDLAELASRAARHLVAAGRRAARRQDDAGAAALLSRGVALLAEGNAASRLEPLFDLGTALIRRGDTAAAEEVLAEARRGVVAAGDPRAEVRMRILDLTLKRLVDPEWWAENGRATATQVLTRCQELGDVLDEAKAWHLLGKVHSDRGEQAAAAEALERALEQAERAGDPGVEAWIRYWLLQAAVFGPTPCDRVVARAREDVEWARAHDNRALEGSTLGRMGEMLARSGRVAEAQDAFAEARRIFDDLGLPVHIAYHAASTATSEPLASDPRGAERELRFALDYFESVGAKAIQATIMPMLATTLVPQERYDEAIELSERAEEVAGSDDLDAKVRWRIVRAQALLRLGEVAAAEALAREAVDLASASDTVILHANALACLGDVLGASAMPAEAVPVLESAVALYEAKGDVVSAARARELLETSRLAR